ncbi:kinetochore protein NDC80 homolog [Paramisgurnus dabryanus]|uniref:kinetochore protein NDC80 homolog n=1 Tax=Paramisgurnus dabryanus TaxID=90735 RepID=UPI0031F40DAC
MSRKPRYSEMPMRVQDGRMSLVYATPQNKENVFGKLNIPKPQSTTSERRTSFFGKGTGAGGRRTSMYGTYGGPEKMKDTRPLHDKTFVQQCIKQLCEFLVERGFPGSITVKTLQSPSTKEFLKIFEFICSFMDPLFQIPTAKVEEEIPRMLKDMGYPFALSKSSMYSIGAPHTWPQALGALIWLIDTVKRFNSSREQDMLFCYFSDELCDLEEGAEYNRLHLDHLSDTYNKFMEGSNTFEDEDRDYLNKLKKMYNLDEALLHSQQEKHAMLMEHVERLERESQTDRLIGKRTEKLRLQADLQKLQNYRSTLEAHKAGLENKFAGLSEELEAAEMQLEGLKQDRTRLQHILENQKFTPADIERINQERNELQQTVQSLNQSLEGAEQLVWNEEVNLSKTKEKAELKVTEFNKLGRKLKLIPQTAENACGHDFEIKADYSFTTITQYKTHIQNPLKNMLVDVEDEYNRHTNVKLLSLEEAIEQVRSNIFDKENDLKQLKEQICKVDQQLEHDMQEMAQEEEKWKAELDSAETYKKRLEKKVMQGCEKAEEELKAAQQQYHLVVQETNEENRMVSKNLTDIFSSAVNYLCAVENKCSEQSKKFDKLKDVMREDEADLEQLTYLVENFMKKENAL